MTKEQLQMVIEVMSNPNLVFPLKSCLLAHETLEAAKRDLAELSKEPQDLRSDAE
jgi:hypothetical protein